MIRDEEIKRLKQYAKDLGCKILIKSKSPYKTVAMYQMSPPTITIYQNRFDSKTYIILTLLHELGHHLDYLLTKKTLSEAFSLEESRTLYDPPLPKKFRKQLYKEEISGIKLMPKIAEDVGLKLPKWKIILEMKLDIWIYKYYYKTGDFPTIKQANKKSKELKKKLVKLYKSVV